MSDAGHTSVLAERRLVLVVVDLAGFTRATARSSTDELAALLSAYFEKVGTSVADQGGRVVKYLGDGALAAFDADRAEDAVDCVLTIADAVSELATTHGVSIELGANVHMATVHEGEIGPAADRRWDVIGWGVMHAFRLGAGPGLRISEPVYRSLPSHRRSSWHKNRAPATYRFRP